MRILNETRVNAAFRLCFFMKGDHPSERIVVGGLGILVMFHAMRIGQNLRYIREMLAELPDEFKTGRVEFHKACMDRRGNRWVSRTMGVGELTVEKLVQLGIAGGLIECEQGRQRWSRPPAFRVKV